MQYLITFLEGLISFISPCMLPMLPMYVSYFAGNADQKQKTLWRALAFVVGFSVVFLLLGLFSGTVGRLLMAHQTAVNLTCGLVVILFGLSYLGLFRLPFFRGMGAGRTVTGIVSAFLFGVVYSVSLTPCVGAFLGSALMLASTAGSAVQGMLLLLAYSVGLGIPFFASAILIERLNGVFAWIKRHYRIINLISGAFLILVGLAMMTGLLRHLLVLFGQ